MRNTSSRRGSLLVELLVCGALLGVMMSTTLPTLQWVMRQRTLTNQRELAVLAVDNLMERLTAVGAAELTADRAAEIEESEPLAKQLPASQWGITVDPDPDDPTTKIVRVELTWESHPGRPVSPVRLTAWVSARRAGAPRAP
ncbi:MAG: type II secretion system protein [Planctomycetes bacterium]|nr:type II secretion system protein [Planctomycetota bacterium]